jgi:hypothetical protein
LPVRFIGSEREKIGAGFACRIWGTRVERRFLGEFPSGAERAIDLVGGNLNKTLHAMAAGTIEKDARADDIRVNEIER